MWKEGPFYAHNVLQKTNRLFLSFGKFVSIWLRSLQILKITVQYFCVYFEHFCTAQTLLLFSFPIKSQNNIKCKLVTESVDKSQSGIKQQCKCSFRIAYCHLESFSSDIMCQMSKILYAYTRFPNKLIIYYKTLRSLQGPNFTL